MRWEQRIRYASISDVGFRRGNNEDAYAVHVCSDREDWQRRGHLFMVADGMGGHAVGELASKMASDTIPHTFMKDGTASVPDSLRDTIIAANRVIFERGTHNRDFERMGTTCTALVLSPEGAIVGHVGDSRVYRVRGNRIDQLSFDHSLHWEIARSGRMSLNDLEGAEGKNVITRCLGPDADVQVDIEGPHPIRSRDRYVLCSDGLTSHVKDEEIGVIARELEPEDACRLLVNLANLRGGSDNTTVLVIEVGDLPESMADVQPPPVAAEPSENSWPWLLAAWGIAAALVVGLLLVARDSPRAGFAVMGTGVLTAAGTVVGWLRRRKGLRDPDVAGAPGGPHRSNRFRLDRPFVDRIASLVKDFEATAREKDMTIHEEKLRAATDDAEKALSRKNLQGSFRHYAKAIDVMMDTVHEYRKQRNREQKWGRPDSPPGRPDDAPES